MGGDFTSIGGQTRNRIARLDAATGAADSFDPNASSDVYSIAVQADGKILAGGVFTQHRRTGAQPHRPARCHDRRGGFVQPERERGVYSIAVQADGKILAGGFFSEQHRRTDAQSHCPARCHDRSLADSFNPNANNHCPCNRGAGGRQDFGGRRFHQHRRTDAQLHRPARCHDWSWPIRSTRTRTSCLFNRGAGGRQDFGGRRFHAASAEQTRNYIARLDATNGLADSFDPNANQVMSIQSRCRRTARF